MSLPLNSYFLLWLIGIWQPIGPSEISKLLSEKFENQFDTSDEDYIFRLCQKYTKEKLLVRVNRKHFMYSLSEKGSNSIPEKMRRSKDKTRLFLLKDLRRTSVNSSHDGDVAGLGDEPSLVVKRFKSEGAEAKLFASFVPTGRRVWPRPIEQFSKTGTHASSCDNSFPKYLSFYQYIQIPVARDIHQVNSNYLNTLKIDEQNLALMLGISEKLITSIIKNEHYYYKHFNRIIMMNLRRP